MDGGPTFETASHSGTSYYRAGAKVIDKSEDGTIELDLTATDLDKVSRILFDDWNEEKNNFGLVRDASYTDDDREAAKAKISLL